MNVMRRVTQVNGFISMIKHQTRTAARKCWSCERELNQTDAKAFFCPCEKNIILPVNNDVNYFEMFDLQPAYKIDKSTLTKNFRQLMRKLHPDLFTLKSEIEKKYSSEQSSRVNKAYRVLMSPIARGLYLLELANIEYEKEAVESADAQKTQILMDILELNERIEEIRGPKEVEEMEKYLEAVMQPFKRQLEAAFERRDYKLAVDILSKMKYYRNIDERLKDLKLKYNLNSE